MNKEIKECPLTFTGKHQMEKHPIVWRQVGLFRKEPFEFEVQCKLCGIVDDRIYDKNGRLIPYWEKLV